MFWVAPSSRFDAATVSLLFSFFFFFASGLPSVITALSDWITDVSSGIGTSRVAILSKKILLLYNKNILMQLTRQFEKK